jgi:hypothetical protein
MTFDTVNMDNRLIDHWLSSLVRYTCNKQHTQSVIERKV